MSTMDELGLPLATSGSRRRQDPSPWSRLTFGYHGLAWSTARRRAVSTSAYLSLPWPTPVDEPRPTFRESQLIGVIRGCVCRSMPKKAVHNKWKQMNFNTAAEIEQPIIENIKPQGNLDQPNIVYHRPRHHPSQLLGCPAQTANIVNCMNKSKKMINTFAGIIPSRARIPWLEISRWDECGLYVLAINMKEWREDAENPLEIHQSSVCSFPGMCTAKTDISTLKSLKGGHIL
ncbi:hypothetical protein B0H13DRAFT_1851534 [Mycena leptocephala]|nr:hypothetical protein B0H13DRAFT_1851534 [Mycena leptocephala]